MTAVHNKGYKVKCRYNKFNGNEFSVNYIYSSDGGESFSEAFTIYSGTSSAEIIFPDHLTFEPFNLVSSPQDLELANEYSLSLFPNPASGFLTITSVSKSSLSTWSIHTMEGKGLNFGKFNCIYNSTKNGNS